MSTRLAAARGAGPRRRGSDQTYAPDAARRARPLHRGPITLVHPGWLVAAASLALCVVGLVCIDLASGLRSDGLLVGTARRQVVFLGIGLLAATAVAIPHYRRAIHLSWPAAVVAVALLVFLLLPGVPESIVRPRKGARRWIDLGFTEFQPSELAKVAYVLVTAAYLRFRANHRRLKGLLIPALIAFVPMALVLVEPDLGTSMLFMPALIAMLVAAGAKLKHLIGTGALGAAFAGAVIGVSLVAANAPDPSYPLLRPHQVERIQAVVDQLRGDDRFVQERGFQGRQATTLVGAGGLAGHDADHSRALVYFSSLPERHNDMIFAVYANRFGMIGVLVLLGLYALWAAGALWTAAVCKEPFGRLVCVGFAALVVTQMGINVGMTLGLLPITGMTLPFVSYGGSSLVMGFVMVGIICNIAMRRPQYLWRRSFEFDDG